MKKYGKWGFINNNGDEIVPFIYDKVGEFKNGFAGVCKGFKWGLVDKNGEEVVACLYNTVVMGYDINPFSPFYLKKSKVFHIKKRKEGFKKHFINFPHNLNYYTSEDSCNGFINVKGVEYWED